MINFEYKITEQEYRDYCLYSGWQSPDKKSKRIKYYATYMFIYFGGLFFLFSISSNFRFSLAMIVVPIIIGSLLFLYLRNRIASHYDRHVKEAIKESGEDNILTTANLTFSESGIFGKTNSSEVRYSWSAIIKNIEVNNCYYLYLTSLQAIIIPKRIFNSPDDKIALEKMLLQNIPLKATLENIAR